jgi:hypothetical protein
VDGLDERLEGSNEPAVHLVARRGRNVLRINRRWSFLRVCYVFVPSLSW